MLQLNVVQLNTRKMLIVNNQYIMHDNFEKKYTGKMYWVLLQEINWSTGYFLISRLCYYQRFEDIYNTLTNVAEAYNLSSNKASNIITLKKKYCLQIPNMNI